MEIVASTLAESYGMVMRSIIWNHRDVITEDNEKTWQAEPMHIIITNPGSTITRDYIHDNSPYGKQFYEQYASAIVYGYDNLSSEFEYDYHSRLFEYYDYDGIRETGRNTNQIKYVIDKINSQMTTRRAIAITWNPSEDTQKKDVPCLQLVQFFVENGKLSMYITFRSQDVLMAYPQNVYGLSVLLKYVCAQTGLEIGKYYHNISIPHLYNIRDKNYLKPWM